MVPPLPFPEADHTALRDAGAYSYPTLATFMRAFIFPRGGIRPVGVSEQNVDGRVVTRAGNAEL